MSIYLCGEGNIGNRLFLHQKMILMKLLNSSLMIPQPLCQSVLELEVQQSVELLSEKRSNEDLVSVICHENVIQTEDVCAEDHLDLSNNGKSTDDELSPEMSLHCLPVNGSLVVEETKDSHEIKNNAENMIPTVRPQRECLDGIMILLRQAVESGSAVILDDGVPLDANIVYERSVALAKSAPPGPVFQHRIKKVFVRKLEKEKTQNYEEEDVEVEAIAIPEKRSSSEKNLRSRKRGDLKEVFSEVVPHGSLGVDELAKLLA